MRRLKYFFAILALFVLLSPGAYAFAAEETEAATEVTEETEENELTPGDQEEADYHRWDKNRIMPMLLLSLSAAFSVNFVIVLLYSRDKKNPDNWLMSGNCRSFEIQEAETERQR